MKTPEVITEKEEVKEPIIEDNKTKNWLYFTVPNNKNKYKTYPK